MARGKDSAGDPRRALSPAIRDAVQAQNARRAYMFGDEESLAVDTETNLSKMNPLNQVRAVVAIRDSVDSDIASSMSRPPHGRRNHASRLVGDQLAPRSASYTMTLGEYQARTSGLAVAGPSSLDPFSLGSGASARDSAVSSERPEAAWKRTGQPTGEESTTKPSASMVEAEETFKKTSGRALMHPSTFDELSKEKKKTTKTPGY